MARKKIINVNDNNSGEEVKNSEENQKPVSMDQIGSEEFYQGKKIIEDVELPGGKKIIKTETVKKEEIYEDKIKQQAAFIASLGRKNETKGKSGQEKPEYVEEKSSRGKKIASSLLIIIILGALAGGGYWLWANKKTSLVSDEASRQVIIPAKEEPPVDNSAEEQKAPEIKPIEEVKSSEIAIKVLNVGAAAGSAGKIKTVLVGQGYAKAEAGNGQGGNVVGSAVYYKGEQFKKTAEALREILATSKIKSEAKEAMTAEQLSADVVVMLGK